MKQFFNFLFNNYYGPLQYHEFADMFEEWLEENPEAGSEWGAIIGQKLGDDIVATANLPESEQWKLEVLQDELPLIYEYTLAKAYYDYLVIYFASVVQDPALNQI